MLFGKGNNKSKDNIEVERESLVTLVKLTCIDVVYIIPNSLLRLKRDSYGTTNSSNTR